MSGGEPSSIKWEFPCAARVPSLKADACAGLFASFFMSEKEEAAMYQALYRKWRPKTFEDVIGQSHITETLKRQVADGRLSHAYLIYRHPWNG